MLDTAQTAVKDEYDELDYACQSAFSRPSRAQAEEAVRTLIQWAGDDPARKA